MNDNPIEPTFVGGDLFLGRVEEQKRFRAILQEMSDPTDKGTQPYIILLYGDGGIGKTTLARRFRDITEHEEPFADSFHTLWLDWEDLRRRVPALQGAREQINPETVLDLIYKSATNQWREKTFKQYAQAVASRIEAGKEAEKVLSQAGEKDERGVALRGPTTTFLAKLVRSSLPVGETGEAVVKGFLDAGVDISAEAVARLHADLTDRLQRRLKPEQFRLFMTPHEQLAQALGRDLATLTQGWRGKPLFIILDTYEIVDRADLWVREVIKAAGAKAVWVISGRDDLANSRWEKGIQFPGYRHEFAQRVDTYNLGELALTDIHSYFAHAVSERPITHEDAAALSQATHGIPLAIREAADIWRAGANLEEIVGDEDTSHSHEQIVELMTERYLRYAIDNETDKEALYALALADSDTERLRVMLRPDGDKPFNLEARLAQLARDYASVHLREARLHDAAAEFILAYLRPPLRRQSDAVRQLNERAAAALRQQLAKSEADCLLIEERYDNDDWVQAAVALADTLFWLDEDEAWHWLIPRYVEGMAYGWFLRWELVDTASSWREQLSQTGKKRLRWFRDAEGFSRLQSSEDEAERKLLDELDRLARMGWLDGFGKEERLAILTWRRGKWLMQQKKYREAAAALEQAEQGLPEGDTQLKEKLAEAMYDLTGQLIWPDESVLAVYSDEAERLLSKVVEWFPEKQQWWNRLGISQEQGGHFDKALASYQQAITLDPQDANSHNRLGNLYESLGQYDNALTAYHRAITADPDYGPAYNNMGFIYHTLVLYDEAIIAYQQAIAIDPKVILRHINLGDVYSELARYEDAVASYQQAITLDPKNADSYDSLGNLYRNTGRYDDAIANYQQAIALNPELGSAHTYLAVCYRHLGRESDYQTQIEIARNFMVKDTSYNRACFEAICGNITEAITLLAEALNRTPGLRVSAKRDPDFSVIQDDLRFQALFEKANR